MYCVCLKTTLSFQSEHEAQKKQLIIRVKTKVNMKGYVIVFLSFEVHGLLIVTTTTTRRRKEYCESGYLFGNDRFQHRC